MTYKLRHTIHSSTVVDADPDSVWAELRDTVRLVKIVFGDAVVDVDWTEGGSPERVPARYDFTIVHTGDVARQEIVGRDELARTVTYRAHGRVLCILDYVGTYRVLPVTNDPGRSYVEWSREFKITDDATPEVIEGALGMMENQINSVRDFFAKPE